MENTLPVRQPRSFVRRVALPLCLSLAVLSGAGWGVYRFSTHSGIDTAASSGELAHSALSATDGLKNLFSGQASTADNSPAPSADPFQAKTTNTESERYPKAEQPTVTLAAEEQLPPLVAGSQETETLEPKPANFSSDAHNVAGDRYSSSPNSELASPSPLEVAETTASRPSEESASLEPINQDVQRGQEPNGNPLRAAGQAAEIDAHTAFEKNKSADDASSALFDARPLRQENAASQTNSRYRAGQGNLAEPPAGLGSAPAEAVSQGPAPAFNMEQPNLDRTSAPSRPPRAQQGIVGENITPTPGLTSRPGTGRPGEQLLEGSQSPSITIQKLAPEEIQVGKRCTFAIRVQNTGQRTAQNVQIHDEVPLGTELAGTAPRAAVSGSHVVWDLGTLSVGEERTVEMELIPIEEGELGSVATVTLTALASAKARCTRPELALRLSCQPQVHEGQPHVVQVEVSNPGSGSATGVMLLSNLPQSVSHAAGPALEYEIGTLRPGESRRMELILTAKQAGKINNVMTARADANLRVEANCEFEILAPELQLTIEGPKRRYLERPATYQINVDNPGTATANEVQLVTRMPKGLQFVSANNLGEYDPSSHTVRWSLAELPANERGTVELVALPIEAGEQVLRATTSARPGLEDRMEKMVLVEGLAALTFEVTDIEGLIEVGGETTYEIVVANQGSKAADNVQVVAIMPSGMQALSGQGETRHTIQGERVTFSPLPKLAPKAETIFRIQARGMRPGDQRVRVLIKTDELQQPITKEVNTRVYAD